MSTPEGLDRLDYTIKYDVGLEDWTRIKLNVEILVDGEVMGSHEMTPQRCLRRRGLFGMREPHDEGTHLEGKVSMAVPADGDETPPEPLVAVDDQQWLGFRVHATYILDPDDIEAPTPTEVVADFPQLHLVQLYPPYGDLEAPRIENTVPFSMTIKYSPPVETAEEPSPEAGGDDTEPAPPPPFAVVQKIEWTQMYTKVMKSLHMATESLIEAGTVIPIDQEAGEHWKHDSRDIMPHDFLFNDKKPRTMEDGEFLDAVEYKDLRQFVFPQHELCSHSGARLIIFANYGPLDENGILRGGKNREEALPEHFSYRWPKAYAAPLTSTKTVMKPLHGGNIARPMKVKELDEVETVIEQTTNPALRVMIEQVEKEDMVTSLSKTANMSANDQNEIISEVYARVRKAYNPQPGDMEAVFRDLPRDVNGNMSFADIQKAIVEEHQERVARSRKMFPDLDVVGSKKKTVPKLAPDGVPEATAHLVGIQRDEEALLTTNVFQMAEAEETKYPGLRQNVMLTREVMTSMETSLSTTKRWDKECCVRKKDMGYVRPSKIML